MALEHLLDGLAVSIWNVWRLDEWHTAASRRFESTSAFLQKGKETRQENGEEEEWVGNTKTTRQLIPYSQPIVSDLERLINIFPADSSILLFFVFYFLFVCFFSSRFLSASVHEPRRNPSPQVPCRQRWHQEFMHRLSAYTQSCNRSTSDCYSRQKHQGTTIWGELKEYPTFRSYPSSLICKFQFLTDVGRIRTFLGFDCSKARQVWHVLMITVGLFSVLSVTGGVCLHNHGDGRFIRPTPVPQSFLILFLPYRINQGAQPFKPHPFALATVYNIKDIQRVL